MTICHEHNARSATASSRPFGIRVSLAPGDPFARLVGADWEKLHWFANENERDRVMADMASRHAYSREGDAPALRFARTEKLAGARPR